MTRRHWIAIGAVAAAVIGAYVAWDALTVTDEERIEAFTEDVTGPVTAARVRAATQRWIDLERQPFEVSALGQALRYEAGEDDALAERGAQATRRLRGSDLRALSSAITIEGDRATVELRLLGRQQGMGQVRWRLRRHGEDWLAERLVVTR